MFDGMNDYRQYKIKRKLSSHLAYHIACLVVLDTAFPFCLERSADIFQTIFREMLAALCVKYSPDFDMSLETAFRSNMKQTVRNYLDDCLLNKEYFKHTYYIQQMLNIFKHEFSDFCLIKFKWKGTVPGERLIARKPHLKQKVCYLLKEKRNRYLALIGAVCSRN